MNAHSKAKLVYKIQKWLDDESVADDLGGNLGIWQCSDSRQRNANLYADAVEIAINGMALQSQLEQENS
jgi:hypothetical protein